MLANPLGSTGRGWNLLVALGLFGLCLWPVRAACAQPSAPASASKAPVPESTPPSYIQKKWTIDDGLPVNAVNDLVRTPNGYLWIATYDGLVRFDGTEFRVYRSGQTPGLPTSRITQLHVHEGTLWLLLTSGEAVRMHEGQFEVPPKPALIRLLYEDSDGTLWAGTNAGLARWRPGRGFVSVRTDRMSSFVNDLKKTEDGALWVGAEDGLYRYAPDGSVRRWAPSKSTPGKRAHELASGTKDSTVWVASRLRKGRTVMQPWTPSGPTRGSPAVLDGSFLNLSVGPEGAAWAATTAHLYRLSETGIDVWKGTDIRSNLPSSESALRFRFDGALWTRAGRHLYRNEQRVFSAAKNIRVTLPGPGGLLWIGTDKGLVQLHPSRVTTWGVPEGLINENLYSIEQRRDGSIWVGTLTKGIARIGTQGVTTFNRFREGTTLGSVFALHEGRSGHFWVGGSHFCRFENGRCARMDVPFPTDVNTYAIHEDSKGRLWVGTLDGLYVRADATDDTAPWTKYTPENSGLPHAFVRVIRETEDGTLWLGTNTGGIARYRNGTFASFTTADGLPSNIIRDIYPDSTGTFWVATEDNGLARIRWADGQPDSTLRAASLTHYDKEVGLFDNALHRILPDDQGRFWISSNRGLFWVRRRHLEAVARGTRSAVRSVAYTTRHGLRNPEFNGGSQPAGIRAEDGRLWFPSQAGAVTIDPASDPVSQPPPSVVVETIKPEMGASMDASTGTVELGPQQRDLSVQYAGIRFRAPEQLEFRYRLSEFKDEWTRVGTRREAFFTKVPPGRHTFEVSVRSARSDWSAPATQTLVLVPRFYETTWFLVMSVALGLVLAVGGVYAGVRYRLRSLRARKERLRKRVGERTEELQEALETVEQQADELAERNANKSRFFTNVSHELRTPLSLILGPAQSLRDAEEMSHTKRRDLVSTICTNAKRLEVLSEQLLDLAKHDEGRLTPTLRRRPLTPFVHSLKTRFVHRARTDGVTLAMEAPAPDAVAAFDADQMETVVVNLLDNALRHTPQGGTVRIVATVEDEHAQLAVHDTGPGIPEADQERLFDRFHQQETPPDRAGGTGIGLALVRALVRLHDGTVAVDSTMDEGTTFTVRWAARSGDEEIPFAEEAQSGGQSAVGGDSAVGAPPLPDRLSVSRGRPVCG